MYTNPTNILLMWVPDSKQARNGKVNDSFSNEIETSYQPFLFHSGHYSGITECDNVWPKPCTCYALFKKV